MGGTGIFEVQVFIQYSSYLLRNSCERTKSTNPSNCCSCRTLSLIISSYFVPISAQPLILRSHLDDPECQSHALSKTPQGGQVHKHGADRVPLEPRLHLLLVARLDIRLRPNPTLCAIVNHLLDGTRNQRQECEMEDGKQAAVAVPFGDGGGLEVAMGLQPAHGNPAGDDGYCSRGGDEATAGFGERFPVFGQRFAGEAGLVVEEGPEDGELEEREADGRAGSAEWEDETQMLRGVLVRHDGLGIRLAL